VSPRVAVIALQTEIVDHLVGIEREAYPSAFHHGIIQSVVELSIGARVYGPLVDRTIADRIGSKPEMTQRPRRFAS
jgi:hypothetical protein